MFESLLGGAVSGFLGFLGQESANETNMQIAANNTAFNADEAQKQRNWLQDMSQTAYPRAVQSMRDAGLNPMLAYSQGPANVTGGAAATAQPARVENSLGAGVSSGFSAYRSIAEVKAVEQEIKNKMAVEKLTSAQEENVRADTLDKLEAPERTKSEAARNTASAFQLKAQADVQAAQLPHIAAQISELLARVKLHGVHGGLMGAQTGESVARTGLAYAETGAARARTGLYGAETAESVSRTGLNQDELDNLRVLRRRFESARARIEESGVPGALSKADYAESTVGRALSQIPEGLRDLLGFGASFLAGRFSRGSGQAANSASEEAFRLKLPRSGYRRFE